MVQKLILGLFAASAVWWWATAPGTAARAEPAPTYGFVLFHADGTAEVVSSR